MLTNGPVDIVIFGGTGDLAMRKLFPSLYHCFKAGHLSEGSRIIGAARTELDNDSFRDVLQRESKHHVKSADFDQTIWDQFVALVFYSAVDLFKTDDFTKLNHQLNESYQQAERVRIFYLSVGPTLFNATCEGLSQASLITPYSRIVVEKPLGRDLKSSIDINETLASLFEENQIFRIDHYLGKETVQNLFALRFGNSLFEPLWRRGRIRDVQITVAETLGIGTRGEFYDRTGAMRDMVQSHLLQLLCIIAMECPTGIDADAMRDEKRKVLRALRPIIGPDVASNTVRGRYRAGAIAGETVKGYLEEDGVDPDSHTETFVSIRAEIDTWRWAGVPFFLRTGKRMQERLTQIVVNFEELPHNIFAHSGSVTIPNKLVIRLQPQESISLHMMAKMPGDKMVLEPVELGLNPERTDKKRHMEAYERLFMDAIKGNLTLFMRRDEVDAAWAWVDPILESWANTEDPPRSYVAGTWGPAKSSSLLVREDYLWQEEN